MENQILLCLNTNNWDEHVNNVKVLPFTAQAVQFNMDTNIQKQPFLNELFLGSHKTPH